jgi:hypothetical protein
LGLAVLFPRLAKQLMRALAIFVFFASAWVPAEATTLQQLTLGELAQKSSAIVRAKVTGSSGVLRGRDVYTIYQFEPLETVKPRDGTAPAEVALPGGVAGGMRQVVAGAPVLRAGQEYVLFLWTGRSGLTQLMGMSQGLFAVERTTAGDVLTTRPAAGEQMLDGTGHAVHDAGLSMPWSELKAKVTKALAALTAGTLAAGRK